MRNPFEYGEVVTGEGFCNRVAEQEEIRKSIEACQRLFLYAERRIGKTSLIQNVIQQLPTQNYLPIYIDLYPTDGEITFAKTMASAITQATSTTVSQLAKTAKKFFSSLKPNITLDDDGNPKINFEGGPAQLTEPELIDILETPEKLSKQTGKTTLVVFDEFQQILEYGNDHVEHMIRSVTQMHQQVAYIFMGSRKHLIQKMFLDRSRPLYRSAKHYMLGKISVQDWAPFIQKRFSSAKKIIRPEEVSRICQQTEGHPFYTQHLCYEVWDLCPQQARVTQEMIAEAVEKLLKHEDAAFSALWEMCTVNQRRLLMGLASESMDAQPHSGEFFRKYHLGSASNVQRSIASLIERDVIEREGKSYIINDRFFKLWIRQLQS